MCYPVASMLAALVIPAVLVLAAIPPLTEDQRGALATADDGSTRDHREAAFFALLQNTAQWTGAIGDAPIRLHPDYESMLADPDAYRGELCRIEGRIEQIEPLLPPYEGVEAWFVRGEGDRPILVYVDFKDREQSRLDFRAGMRIAILARFYKRYERIADGPAGDQRMHVYATFVGGFPQPMLRGADSDPLTFADVIYPLIAVLGGLFVVVWMISRRARGRSGAANRQPRIVDSTENEIERNLPADPADALAILRDRAENVR